MRLHRGDRRAAEAGGVFLWVYLREGQLLTAKDSGIKGFADLRGKNVVTTAGTTNERFLKSYNVDHKIDMFVISAKDHGEAFQMLQSGRAAAFYMDDALLYGERAKAHDPHKWVVVGGTIAGNLQLHGAQG
jgi:glutamate/aspartate transport system substrate-binding protein